MATGSILFIGNATVLIRYAGFTILTDPNFIHMHEQVPLGYGLHATRLTNPAVEIGAVPLHDLGRHEADHPHPEPPRHAALVDEVQVEEHERLDQRRRGRSVRPRHEDVRGHEGEPGSGELVLNDTWAWNGTAFTQYMPAVPPPYLRMAAIATDLHRQRVILYGGETGDHITREWTGAEWVGVLWPDGRQTVVTGVPGNATLLFDGDGAEVRPSAR